MENLTTQSMLLVAVLTLAGAALGGAMAHWRRGSGHVVTGAVIGGILMFIVSLVGALYSGVIIALGLVALAAILFSATFG